MDRDYGMEIDGLQKEMAEVKSLLQELMHRELGRQNETNAHKKTETDAEQAKADMDAAGALGAEFVGEIQMVSDMHPNPQVSAQMEELCRIAGEGGSCGLIDYMGVFSSGGRQSNWIKRHVDVGELLPLIENHMAEKVLHCIGNNDRLNILLAILKKPRTVAELVAVCGLNSTGQAYHHMKPLLAADLIAEDDASGAAGKGVYIVRPHKVQGIIMLLAGIADMVDETYTKGNWDHLDV